MAAFWGLLVGLWVLASVPDSEPKWFHTFAGPFNVVLKKFDECPDYKQGSTSIHSKIYRGYHQLDRYDINLSIPTTIDDRLTLTSNIASWSSNGGWKENAHFITVKNACSAMFQHFSPLLTYLLSLTMGEVVGCPFLPGLYRTANLSYPQHLLFTPFIQQFVYGKWRIDSQLLEKNGDVAYSSGPDDENFVDEGGGSGTYLELQLRWTPESHKRNHTKDHLKQEVNFTSAPVGKGTYRCKFCKEKLPCQQALLKHLAVHSEGNMRQFQDQKTSRDSSFGERSMSKRKEESRRRTSVELESDVHSVYNVSSDDESSPKKRFECENCGKKYCHKRSLQRHWEEHSGRTYQCSVCYKEFSKKCLLSRHASTHDKKFKCELCGKRFCSSNEFCAHLVVHLSRKLYRCQVCDKEYARRRSLSKHMVTHGGKDFECKYCGMKFYDSIAIERHSLCHRGKKPHPCRVCGRAFLSKHSLARHALAHADKKQKCPQCAQEFSTEKSLEQHQLLHKKTYQCIFCDKKYKYRSSLDAHIRTHGENKFECKRCGKKFFHVRSLNKHLKVHLIVSKNHRTGNVKEKLSQEKEKVKPYQCVVCDQEFFSGDSLDQHIVTHGDTEFECEHCSEKFLNLKDLKTHLSVHPENGQWEGRSVVERSGDVKKCSGRIGAKKDRADSDPNDVTGNALEKRGRIGGYVKSLSEKSCVKKRDSKDDPYKCQYCIKDYKSLKHLKDHLLSHGDNQFMCKECGEQFTYRRSLNRHVPLHLEVKPFRCEVCDKTYPCGSSLNRHKLSHGTKKFPCPLCDRSFTYPFDLKRHSTAHSDNSHRCNVCNASFSSKRNLRKHQNTHSDSKFKCNFCDKKFCHRGSVMRHMTSHRLYRCQVCDEMFVSQRYLIRHHVTHGDTLKCKYCSRIFSRLSTLREHMACHLKHRCRLCKSTFVKKSELKIHLEGHVTSPDTNAKVFSRIMSSSIKDNDVPRSQHKCARVKGTDDDICDSDDVTSGNKDISVVGYDEDDYSVVIGFSLVDDKINLVAFSYE